jgi:hemolysin activation/secretion protein
MVKGVVMGPLGNRLIAATVMLLASLPAVAQIPGSDVPGRERQRFEELPAPRAQPGGAAITLPSTVAPAGAESITLVLRGVTVVGATVYSSDQLTEFYRDLIGHPVTLATVYDIAKRITAKYGADGYVLSRAIVPPQQLSPHGATVRIQVVEGYVDKVEWPAALASYRDFFSYYASRIVADRPANIRTIERYMLLAGDLPGLKFKNSLKASATVPGAATLVVEVDHKLIDAIARIDNRGSKARGPLEYFTGVTVNNPFGLHDAFTFNYAGAFQTRELQYFNTGYRMVLTPEGFTAFINANYSFGRPGTPALQLLDYKTRSALIESGWSYPFIRQRERNLTVSGLMFASDDQSDILDVSPFTLDRQRGFRVRLEADAADPLNAINQLYLVASQGINGLGAGHGSGLPSRANGRLDFNKVEATFTRLQPLVERLSLLVSAYGQYAGKPLLGSELCGYGGRSFGRAYDPSQLLGDRCFEALGELRLDVPHSLTDLTQAQLYIFADGGWLHNIAPVAGTLANVDGASAGGGLRLGYRSVVTADLSVAKAVAGPRDDWRFFFILTGRY